MEAWQKEHISKNIDTLIEISDCNERVLSRLCERGQLTNAEVDDILDNQNSRRNLQFYSYIQIKTHCYAPLIEILFATRQNEAANILLQGYKKYETTPPPNLHVLQCLAILEFKRRTTQKFQHSNTYLKIILGSDVDTFDITFRRIASNNNCSGSLIRAEFNSQIGLQFKSENEPDQILVVWKYDNLSNLIQYTLSRIKSINVLIIASKSRAEVEAEVRQIASPIELNTNVKIVDDIEWNELISNSQQTLREHTVTYQGEGRRIPLQQLLLGGEGDILALNSIRGNLLVDLIYDRCPSVGSVILPNIPNYYIPRRIDTRRIISPDIFKAIGESNGGDVIAISNLNDERIPEGPNINMNKSGDILNATGLELESNIIILEDYEDFEPLCRSFPSKKIHWLDHINIGKAHYLQWISSHGSIELVERHVKKSKHALQDETCILTDELFENGPICISAPSGMGKSTLLGSFAKKIIEKANSSTFVGYIGTLDLLEGLTTGQENEDNLISTEQILQVILDKIGASDLVRILVKSQVHSEASGNTLRNLRRIEIMLDDVHEGLDHEKYSEQTVTVLKLLKHSKSVRLWVSTTPHSRHQIEEILETIAYTIVPLNKESQLTLLRGVWKENLEKEHVDLAKIKVTKLFEFGELCVAAVVKAMKSPTELQLLGVPIHCVVLAQTFAEEARKFFLKPKSMIDKVEKLWSDKIMNHKPELVAQSSITGIYTKLVDSKFDNWWEKTGKRSTASKLTASLSLESAKQRLKNDMKQFHMKLALEAKFPGYAATFVPALPLTQKPFNPKKLMVLGLVDEGKNFYPSTLQDYFIALFISEFGMGSGKVGNTIGDFYLNHVLQLSAGYDAYHKHKNAIPQFENALVLNFLNTMLTPFHDFDFEVNISKTFTDSVVKLWNSNRDDELYFAQALALIAHGYIHLFQRMTDILGKNMGEIKENVPYFPVKDFVYFSAKYQTKVILEVVCKLANANFISAGKDIGSLPYEISQNPLHAAIRRGENFVTSFLIKKAFGQKSWSTYRMAGDKHGRGVLHYSVYKSKDDDDAQILNKKKIITELLTLNKALIEEIPDTASLLDERDMFGGTPLLQKRVHFQLIKHLLEPVEGLPRADITVKDNYENTVLHIFFQDWEKSDTDFKDQATYLIVKYMREKGTNIKSANMQGETIMQIATRTGNMVGIEVLEKYFKS